MQLPRFHTHGRYWMELARRAQATLQWKVSTLSCGSGLQLLAQNVRLN
jgi:hypothetical protein